MSRRLAVVLRRRDRHSLRGWAQRLGEVFHTEERLERLYAVTSGWPWLVDRVHRLHTDNVDADQALRSMAGLVTDRTAARAFAEATGVHSDTALTAGYRAVEKQFQGDPADAEDVVTAIAYSPAGTRTKPGGSSPASTPCRCSTGRKAVGCAWNRCSGSACRRVCRDSDRLWVFSTLTKCPPSATRGRRALPVWIRHRCPVRGRVIFERPPASLAPAILIFPPASSHVQVVLPRFGHVPELDAVAGTVARVRREHRLVMNSLGVEKPQEWLGDDRNGYAAQIAAHLLVTGVHRARLLGYGRKDLVRLLDATGIE
ncbi:hypothetical protein SHIRM173S_12233 [Streptomyces hirsutus]